MKKIRTYIRNYLNSVDRYMLFLCVATSVFGVAVQFSLFKSNQAETLGISQRAVIVQLFASLLGISLAIGISNFDYHIMAKLWKLYIPFSVFLVILTFFIGLQVDETVDDKAWLRLPFGLSFQPSELLKICFIMSFAYHLSKVKKQLNRPINMLLLCLHGLAPVMLIHLQGDDGTALVFAFIFAVMLFSAGVDWKYMLGGALLLAGAIPIGWQYLLTDDQRKRFLSVYISEYADPLGADYQQSRSRISIGLGNLLGKGLFGDDYWYVPKMHNDFVFAYIGQAVGFVGSMLVIAVLLGICLRSLTNARTSLDPLGSYICYGFFAMFFFQCVINIGMCISVLPVIGITLPLLSAGGTSICITYIGIGLVLSVKVHSRQNIFST